MLIDTFRRYGLAIIVCALALAVAWSLNAPSSCFFLAVMVSSLYGGKGPSLLSIVLSALSFDYFFLPPRFQLSLQPASYGQFAVFLGAAALIAVLVEAKRRVEESRREIHAQYRIIADTAPDAIVTVDHEGRILFMNPATTGMFGWAAPELMGQPLTILIPKFQLADRSSGAAWIGRRKDGTEFAAEVSFGEVSGHEPSTFTGFIRDISERRRAEAALQKSESYLASAQRLSHTGSFGWNLSTGTLHWSEETYRVLGYTAPLIPTMDLMFQRVHPADAARVRNILDAAPRNGNDLDFEYRQQMPDGSVRHIHVSSAPVTTDFGATEYVGAVMDITTSKSIEIELRRSEEYLEEAQRLSHTGSWVWNVDPPGPAYWSAELYRMAGRDPAQGLPTIEQDQTLHPPADWAGLMDAANKAVGARSGFEYNSRFAFPDGSYKNIRIVGHPVLNEAGEVVQLVGTTIDVTEQFQAREALQKAFVKLQKSEDRFRVIINTIPTPAWSSRPDGSVDFVNQRWLDYTGLSAIQALDWGWRRTFHPDDLPHVLETYKQALASGQPFEVEGRARRFDGQFRWFLCQGCPLRDESGRVVQWYGTNTDIEDRKRAEEALRASEQSLRLIVNSIPGLVSTRTATGDDDLVNERVTSYTGKTVEEMKDWLPTIHPDDRALTAQRWRQAVETGSVYDVEERIQRADGVYRWFHARGLPLRDAEGHAVRWYILLTDIEDRKQAESALRASEQNFRLIVDSIPGLVSMQDAAGLVELVNRQIRDYTGLTLEDLRDWLPIVHPDDRELTISQWARSVESGHPLDIEVRLRRADGVYCWFHARALPVRDDSGYIVRWYTLLTDIEDRKAAEAALRARERDLTLIIETIPALVWCAAPDGQLTYVNERVLEYTGTTLDALAQSGWVNFLHPDDVDSTVRNWLLAVGTGRPHDIQYRLRRGDGAYRWFHVLGQPVRDAEGRITRWYGLLVDIDDRKNMEEALRSTQTRLSQAAQIATVGELAASIAHEVNQPLAAVVANGHACLRWLLAQPPNLAKAHEAAERIVRDGKDAGEVVRRIRALFKRAPLEKAALDLNEIIGEVLDLVRAETAKKRVTVETELENGPTSVVGDRVQLQQLVLNLLLNGIEAMDPVEDRPKKLFIRSMRHNAEMVVVEIQDCGVGLKDPDKIFEAFFTTKENGMGMGLAICRSIVEAHNGRLWATSEEACGTKFCIALPQLSGAAQ
jgi:PAS domain S-box-containing protein